MKILFFFLFTGLTVILPLLSYSQNSDRISSNMAVYKSSLFERQLIQRANSTRPNSKTGVFSGVVSNYELDNHAGFADIRLNTISAPKPIIYSYIIFNMMDFYQNSLFTNRFRDSIMNLWIKFSDTYKMDKNQNFILKNKSDYLILIDSLEKIIRPYYPVVNSIGARILDSIQSVYSNVTQSKTQIIRNTKISKLDANKFWETSFTLFDAYTDNPISLELSSPPKYSLFIYNDTDNLDSLINLRISDIQNNLNITYHNSEYSPNELSTISGIKFQNFDNFYKWAKINHPDKFNRNVNSSLKKTDSDFQSSNITSYNPITQSDENKNLQSFLTFLKGSGSNVNNKTNSNNQSFSTTKQSCYLCKGTGKCGNCSKIFSKPYYVGNGKYQSRNESRPGLVLCGTCFGRGHKQISSNFGGWEPSGDCSVYGCQDGWVTCQECNSGGNGRNIGKCKNCNGTGSR